jgi:hypothetical protein
MQGFFVMPVTAASNDKQPAEQAAPTEQPAQQPDPNALANDPFGPLSNLGADALKAQVNQFGGLVRDLMERIARTCPTLMASSARLKIS